MKEVEELLAALTPGFMLCRSGNGKPSVVIEFGNLRDDQRLHRALIDVFRAASRNREILPREGCAAPQRDSNTSTEIASDG